MLVLNSKVNIKAGQHFLLT